MEKKDADLLIVDSIIITMDGQNRVIDNGSIAIIGDSIAAIGSTQEVLSAYQSKEMINASDHIVMPGLVDTHFHTGQQFERAIYNKLSKFMELREPIWKNYLIPFEANLSDDDIYLSGLFAYSNLLKSGTTCFADAGGPRPEFMAPAIEKTGIRGVLCRSTHDINDGIPPEMQDTPSGVIEKGEELYKRWNGKAEGRIRVWLGMRQIMICSEDLLKNLKNLADRLKTGIHIHLAEGTYEVDYSIEKSGKRPAEYLASIGFLGPNIHAAHSVFLSDHELDLYKDFDVSVSHCPATAFQFIGLPRIPEMLRRGIRVGLGSDGAISSGGSIDLFRQMQISFNTFVVTHGIPYRNPFPIFPYDFLIMATIGGARALSWEKEIGSLEVGKKADLILLSCNDLDVLPAYEPVFLATNNCSAAQVKTVLVNGKIVVKDRHLVNVDEEELISIIKERAPRIVDRFLERLH